MTTASNRNGYFLTLGARLAPILLFAIGNSSTVLAETEEVPYCAFVLTVHSPSGTPAAKVGVAMIRADHTTYSDTVTDSSGTAKFCDAPMAYVDLAVGRDICGSILLRHLPPSWPITQRLIVTYADIPCDHMAVAPQCRTLLRVLDGNGHPVAGARFDDITGSGSNKDISDAFGRIFSSVKRGGRVEGWVMKNGKKKHISQICSDDVESEVILR